MVFHDWVADKFKEGWNSITGKINDLGHEITGAVDDIEDEFKDVGNQIKDASVKGFWKVEHTIESGAKSTIAAFNKGFSSIGRFITDEAEEIGAAGINFVTDGVEDIDKGLGFVTAEIVEYVPKMYNIIIPRIMTGVYQTITKVMPEILTIPGNIGVFLVSLFLTVVGESFMAKANAENKEKFKHSLGDIDPSILHPDLDMDEAERILGAVVSYL